MITSAIGFIMGLALFGAVTFLPLYLQVVKGHSPTASGLQLLPMMGGVLVTSILSGNLISRIGRYRAVPDHRHRDDGRRAVPALDASASTPPSGTAGYMVVLGLGLGMVMQVLVLAVQNAVDYRYLGVATSGSTLFRQIGGSIGVSLFGAIFSNQAGRRAASRLRSAEVRAHRGQPGHRLGTSRRRSTSLTSMLRARAAAGVPWPPPDLGARRSSYLAAAGVPLRKTAAAEGVGERSPRRGRTAPSGSSSASSASCCARKGACGCTRS